MVHRISCFDPVSGKMKRSRLTQDLNRIKDPVEKEFYAQSHCTSYRELLEGGWSPSCLTSNTSKTTTEGLKIGEYLRKKGLKKNSAEKCIS
jgi:hypothetical protein